MGYRFSDWLEYLAKQHGNKPALTCGVTLTFKELWDASRHCAILLNQAGVQKGDRVILWGINGVDWVTGFFGITMAGGIATLMNYGLKAEDVTFLTEMVGADWALLGKNKVTAADPAAAVRAFTKGSVPSDHILSLEGLFRQSTGAMQATDEEAFRELNRQTQPEDTQLIVYTSGTTSVSKAVQLSSNSVITDMKSAMTLMADGLTPSVSIALPLFHCFGLIVLLGWLDGGNHVFLAPEISPPSVMKQLCENQISGLASVAAIYSGLTQLPDFEEKLANLLKLCFVGGSFVTPSVMMRVENALNGGKLLIGYGLSECSPVVSVNTSSDPLELRALSVGHVIPGEEVRIWKEQVGFLNPGEIGEIVVRGPNTMNGYWGVPQEQQPFDSEGWLHTGDLGMLAENGMLYVAGRIKDIIIRNGENIAPLEIEQAIMEALPVQDVKVFGAPHPIWGESVEACMVPRGALPDEDTIRDVLRKRLSSYKIPSHFFMYPVFPVNSNGKLDQRSLKADMLERLRSLYISNALHDGLAILSVTVGNRDYTIPPVCDLVQGIARELQFSEKRISRIRLAVEEMLTERISNAYDSEGKITVEVILLPQWIRVRFRDTGRPYRLDGENSSLSARIILANADAYSSHVTDRKMAVSCLDWQYAEGFDINRYLLRYREPGKTEKEERS